MSLMMVIIKCLLFFIEVLKQSALSQELGREYKALVLGPALVGSPIGFIYLLHRID